LPVDFHSQESFDSGLSIVKKFLGDSSVFKSKKIDPALLLLGLVYREVCRSMEIEPDSPTTAPSHLRDSLFGIKELNKIETLLDAVVLPPTSG
jgi:hypothetical protein